MGSTDATAIERPLRLFMYLTTAITCPLDIAATILSLENQRSRWSRRHVTAFAFVFIPLALTALTSSISLLYMRKHGKSPRALHFKVLDLVSAVAYLGVLIPCWSVEIRQFRAPGFGLLIGYVTAPMIVNMFLHGYFALNCLPWKQLFSNIPSLVRSGCCQQCPHCQAKRGDATPAMNKTGYSLLRGEDYLDIEAGPTPYRDSEDFLREDDERAERAEQPEQARAAEDSGKSKAIAEI